MRVCACMHACARGHLHMSVSFEKDKYVMYVGVRWRGDRLFYKQGRACLWSACLRSALLALEVNTYKAVTDATPCLGLSTTVCMSRYKHPIVTHSASTGGQNGRRMIRTTQVNRMANVITTTTSPTNIICPLLVVRHGLHELTIASVHPATDSAHQHVSKPPPSCPPRLAWADNRLSTSSH